jgi:hypothetical protein
MQIYIQNKLVRTKILELSLFHPYRYEYSSTKFKSGANKDKEEAEKQLTKGFK